MRLNHINLAVTDVPSAQAFFETHFNLRFIGSRSPDKLVVLADDNDSIITLSNMERRGEIAYPRSFHIGFSQPSRAAVEAIHDRLLEAGHQAPAPRTIHGAWSFYFEAPGGVTVEVLHQPQIPGVRPVQ